MIFDDNTELIKHLVEGDEKAYVYLVKMYHKKLFVYALSLTKDHAMAQDIVQEVFLKTWQFRKKLNSDYSINGFLYKSVYNEFINAYHKNRSMMNLEKEYIGYLNEVIEETDAADFQEKIKLVTKEIENLPEKSKEIFLLSKKEGLTNIEISEYLNLSVKSVEAHITKAYSVIRKNTSSKIINFLFFCLYPKKAKSLIKE